MFIVANPRKIDPSFSTGKVLVLGSDTRAFLSVMRSLGRAGLTVHVAGCPAESPARHSRYVSVSHQVPPPGASNQWRAALMSLMETEAFDLVIPCDDLMALPLNPTSKHVDQSWAHRATRRGRLRHGDRQGTDLRPCHPRGCASPSRRAGERRQRCEVSSAKTRPSSRSQAASVVHAR